MAKSDRKPWHSRLAYLVPVCAIVAGVVWLAMGSGPDSPVSRPEGTVEDLESLRDRDDLNVIFILVDTLRADRLGAYGYERPTSPNLDKLAAHGVRFSHHVAQSSWTKCSMASLWTGLYPARTRVLRHRHAVAEEALLPAEIFKDNGFRTAGIWRNGWIAPNFGFGQGFELYHSPKPSAHLKMAQRRKTNPGMQMGSTDSDVILSAEEFLRAHGHERFFLYLHLMDVHQYGFTEETALFGSEYSDFYDNSILWVDSLLGILFDVLGERGLLDKTLIVFASDHGEAFGEHNGEGHARNVYGEVTETPLILSFPFSIDPGVLVETRSENVDIWPTILDILGLPGLEDPDGRSLLPDMVAAVEMEHEMDETDLAFAQIDQTWGKTDLDPRPMVAHNQGPWRLIYRAASPRLSELYDKTRDPKEQTNLASTEPEVLAEMNAAASEYLKSRPPPWGEVTPMLELDEVQLQQLRALGYGVQ